MNNFDSIDGVYESLSENKPIYLKLNFIKYFLSVYRSELKETFYEDDYVKLIDNLDKCRTNSINEKIKVQIMNFENIIINDYVIYIASEVYDMDNLEYIKKHYAKNRFYKFILKESFYQLSSRLLDNNKPISKKDLFKIRDEFLPQFIEYKKKYIEIKDKLFYTIGECYFYGIKGFDRDMSVAELYFLKCNGKLKESAKEYLVTISDINEQKEKDYDIQKAIENENVKKQIAEYRVKIENYQALLKELEAAKKVQKAQEETKAIKTETNKVDNPTNYDSVKDSYKIQIKEFIKERGIKYLVHFTDESNVASIKKNGILSVYQLEKRNIDYSNNDANRFDNKPNYISLSITKINDLLLKNFRFNKTILNPYIIYIKPSILYEMDNVAIFYETNAANKTANHGVGINYFKNMFAETIEYNTSNGQQHKLVRTVLMKDNETTDNQAEILFESVIPVEYIDHIEPLPEKRSLASLFEK